MTALNYEWFRYVPHHLIKEYEVKGWTVVSDLGGRAAANGHWSVLMKWLGSEEPK